MEITFEITDELIRLASSKPDHLGRGVGWTRKQMNAVGVSWPLVAGWREQLVGTKVSPEAFYIFMKLDGLPLD